MIRKNHVSEQVSSDAEANHLWHVTWAWLRGAAGAIAGGFVGWYLLFWLLSNGLLALVAPGALVGVGFGLASRRSMPVAGWVCGIAALIFGLYCDHATYVNGIDDTFVRYLMNLQNTNPINLIMIVVGAVVAFWLGKGR